MDLFQPVFKQYKKRHPFPDLTDVIDFENAKELTQEVSNQLKCYLIIITATDSLQKTKVKVESSNSQEHRSPEVIIHFQI